MAHYKLPDARGDRVRRARRIRRPDRPQEWMSLEYVDWKSGGDTRFAPLASAYGEIECNGFWHFDPPKADKDGVWIDSQVEKAPTLVKRALEVGANVGRCRIIELQPNTYADALYNSHQDDNNRLNPDGEGWVIRCFMNLTDDQDTYMILREDINDPESEVRIKLAGRRPVDGGLRAPVALRVARRRRAALLPDHLVRVRSRGREVDVGEQPPLRRQRHRDRRRGVSRRRRSRHRSAATPVPPTTATTPLL